MTEASDRTLAIAAPARSHGPSLRRWLRRGLLLLAAVFVIGIGAAGWWIHSLGPAPLGKTLEYSKLVVDRNGKLLRAYTTSGGRWRLPATVDEVDPRFFKVLFTYEDKRFREHHGVDPLAMSRAVWQFVSTGHVVSGASTLTMQVARLLEPRPDRTIGAKLFQMVRAIELENALTKDQILSLYLALAPYGGNLEGIRAASLAYFGHEPNHLTLAEAALLVALPQSPETRRPDRSVKAAHDSRDRVLDRVAEAGVFPPDEIARARRAPVPHGRRAMPLRAPQASDAVMAADPRSLLHRLTLERGLQIRLEDLARDRAAALGPKVSVAIIVVDNATGQVLAHVGSPDFFDAERAGQVDMTQALRSPGSALKPFIYGLGFEDGLIHPATLIEDRPVRYGGYTPENFDLTFQGTVTVRQALQMSLNVPAVAVLEKVGASRLSARLAQAGAALVLPKGEVPGLAISLGGVGITLADLTMLYAGLARQGTVLPLTERLGARPVVAAPRRLMEPVAAWYVGDVLLGAPPPLNAVRGRIAFKTGTSYGFRDAWSVGYDGRLTIGVWVGRPDGAPVPGLVGRGAAAPILFDAFARTGEAASPLPPPPRGVLMASTGRLPPPLQRFRPDGLAGAADDVRPRIMFPPDGARLELSRSGGRLDPVALKITGGARPLTVLVNGLPLAPARGRRTVFFDPSGPGFARLTVIDARGATDSVMVRMQ